MPAFTASASGVVGRPINSDNELPSSYKSPCDAPVSQLAIASANASGNPKVFRIGSVFSFR